MGNLVSTSNGIGREKDESVCLSQPFLFFLYVFYVFVFFNKCQFGGDGRGLKQEKDFGKLILKPLP